MKGLKLKKLVKSKVRVGRGRSSGHGKTSGRGMSGQKSRTGASTKFFEGGQTKLIRQLPKAGGFKALRKLTLVITSDKLEKTFKDKEKLTAGKLIEVFGGKKNYRKVKIIRHGEITKKFEFDGEIVLSKSFK